MNLATLHQVAHIQARLQVCDAPRQKRRLGRLSGQGVAAVGG